ncbi:alpha-amylase family glycosyl hydrolase [Actinoplanes aureus]|uniref:1,4-alpha-glucan branching enzyme n=1 Tax=Actinoplanes aureus TaxID=2792083 RepID=A0A931G5P0_9ACTN|nr:alpha-amylase family glycosyl hydrolase [Actinoplanes aureus]MBG0569041.1 alpha amylase C-terminal domain-containing protein [Actinoplanes aureus]
MITVTFRYLTGCARPMFRNARLAGSWDGWREAPMDPEVADDGCPAFSRTVQFDDGQAGQIVRWGVRLDGPSGPNAWAIATEVPIADQQDRYREFTLPGPGAVAEERYLLTWSRRLGAQKLYRAGAADPDLRFAVWAPNARVVEVVFAEPGRPYIADDGTGLDPSMPAIALAAGPDGIWTSDPVDSFAKFEGTPYLFRITNAQGDRVYRTDLHSRWQAGRGDVDPARGGWDGRIDTLEGTVSCSVVVDQDTVRRDFEPAAGPLVRLPDTDFWEREFTPGRPVPTRMEDLVVYELHVGALGYPGRGPGTLADAMNLLDHLTDLGVTAIELMPLAEFSDSFSWGYGDTHHFAIESSAGGRDKYKHFVRACHRRGMAVIQDVVYNHFDQNAERAEWQYDSTAPEQNIYYWYEGRSADHRHPNGGYLDNGSSGFAPRYHAEQVRQMFISSAVELIEEFHVDGLRVDLTQAIHRDNRLHADGRSVGSANLFGQKLLREWSRTLRMVRPSVLLVAEDHSGWDAVTQPPGVGGLGFGATWFAEFCHQLVGDSVMAEGAARLLARAGLGHDGPLPMGQFAHALWLSQFDKVTYSESHDEAGNARGSGRTSTVAVGGAPLWGVTREYAEARSRVVAGLSMLSAGAPMFLMGEEIVAQRPYRFDNVAGSKEDLHGERVGAGAKMFRYYQDLIRLRRRSSAVRSRHIDIVHVNDRDRVIAFTRIAGQSRLLVVASLSNRPFASGYTIATTPDRLPSGQWQETFNSDSSLYGGADIGNFGATVPAEAGRIHVRIPANGLLVFQHR